jgi:hypothetical protein
VAPRLLLLPEVTEIQWTIRPQLAAWAEVRSFDPPGIGREPGTPSPAALIGRAVAEVEAAGGDRFVVLADAWAVPLAVQLARARPGQVAAMALGHPALSTSRDGDRPAVSPAVYDAVTQLVRNDAPTFLRHGVVQVTRGSADEDLAERIIERVPQDRVAEYWDLLTQPAAFGDELAALGVPLLLAAHRDCLMHTEEGFADAVEGLDHVRALVVDEAPCASPAFAEAVRELCEQVW